MNKFNKIELIKGGYSRYSPKLTMLDKVPAAISAIGKLDILQNKTIALFSSSKCPGKVILQTYDLMKNISKVGNTVVRGFHSNPA